MTSRVTLYPAAAVLASLRFWFALASARGVAPSSHRPIRGLLTVLCKNAWLRQPRDKNAVGRVAAHPRALLRRSASPLSFTPPTLGRINLSSLLVFSCDLEATKETMKKAGLLHACYPAASRRDNNMTGASFKVKERFKECIKVAASVSSTNKK